MLDRSGRRLLLGVALALPAPALAASPAPLEPGFAARVDAVFADLDHEDSPGCALGVVRGGALVYARGYGMANLEHSVPISPSSVFDIGSMSKQFTALSVALLARDGKLSLDDDVRKHLPDMPAYAEPITLRHLIHHTSGLRDYTDYLPLAGWRTEDLATDAQAYGLITRQKGLNHRPGHEYLYCNTGYFLLSQIVQRVSGLSLREFADARIFGPLGMGTTRFLDDHTRIVPARAAGYAPRVGRGFAADMSDWEQTGDGAVQTTVLDFARWILNFDDPKVGGAELIRQMQTPTALAGGKAHPYGFGLRMSEYRGLPTVGHGGSWAGYRADLVRFPGEGLALVCLCNLSTSGPARRNQAVADVLLERRFQSPPPSRVAEPEAPGPKPLAVPPTVAQLAEYAGRFWSDELQTTYTLEVSGGSLRIRARNAPEDPLQAAAPDRFFVGHLELSFARGPRGRVAGFRLSAGRIRDLRFVRQEDAPAVD